MTPSRTKRPAPGWYDAQYDNRARIAEHPAILAHWANASAEARERHGSVVEAAYGPHLAECLDVFTPKRANAPVLVHIHGGYWRALGKRDHSFVASPFVDAGAMVVVPGYALCPAVSIEAIALQLTRALAWTWRHARELGGDPSRIVVAGHSAGGHLATMMLACDWPAVARDLPRDLVHAAISVSGVYELEPIRRTPFLARDLGLTEASAHRLSPAFFPPPRGELVTVVGADESEEFHRQAALIGSRWGDRVSAALRVPERHHMDVLHALAESDSIVHREALRLLGLTEHSRPTGRRKVVARSRN